jgi:hypothetical protein
MQPVWVLSVDLQTKTATFQSGLSDAAKSARGAFNEIKSGAGEMGRASSGSMMEARHGTMLFAEELGVHLPRSVTMFLSSLGPVASVMQAAFPFLAIIALATILVEHLNKMREAGLKMTNDQLSFGTVVNNTFNALDTKLLEAGIRADDLNHNHLGALSKQLKLIDMQSLEELVHSFEEVAKAADVVMKDLEGHWYTFGTGSTGAKAALDDFKTHYDALLAAGKGDEASGLLHGTVQQAATVLSLLEQAKSSMAHAGGGQGGDYGKFEEAKNKLKAIGVNLENETTASLNTQLAAQQNLVDVLNAQMGSEQRIADLKKLDSGNMKTADAQADARYEKEKQRQIEEALKEGRAAYLAGLHDQYKEAVQVVQEGERGEVEATREGSIERLVAIQSAMLAERQMGLEDTQFYKELQLQEIQAQKQYDEEQAKQQAEAGREEAANREALAQMDVAALKQHIQLLASTRRQSDQERMADDIQVANAEYAVKMQALMAEAAALDKADNDHLNKLKAFQDKEAQLVRQHADEIAAIKEKAEQQSNQRILTAESQALDAIGSGLTKSIMGHETWSKMITSFGNQAVEGFIKNSLMMMMQQDKNRLANAREAATDGYKDGMKYGGPAGPVLGPVFAAAAFAGVMAFQSGGVVPGFGSGDTVPAMLEPGEGVVPKGVMEGLSDIARNGGFSGGGSVTHVHVRPTYHINTIDGDGMRAALDKHTDVLQGHFENTLRKMNR